MSALTGDRNTPRRDGDQFSFPAGADVVIYAGALVILDGEGAAYPGAGAAGGTSVGVAQARVDNAGGSAGDQSVLVRRGCFRFANSASADEITLADVGSDAYIVDDQTVAKTDQEGDRAAAGVVRDVDDQGVWVDVGVFAA